MDSKHTTDEQITGNWDGYLERSARKARKKGPKWHH
jgi:hypothetical protein